MTDPEDPQEQARLRELEEQLNASLDRCRSIVKDCRDRLVKDPDQDQVQAEIPPSQPGPSPE